MSNIFTILKEFMRLKPYDVEAMKANFPSMTVNEIAKEYYYVDRVRHELLSNKIYSEEFVGEYIAPLDEAWDFLGQYLAKHYCNILGYPF